MNYFKFKNPEIDTIKKINFDEYFPVSENSKDFTPYLSKISTTIAKETCDKNSIRINFGWINQYVTNSATELHTHDNSTFIDTNSTHVLLLILEGKETVIFCDNSDNQTNVIIEEGDVIVFHRSVVHGLKKSNNLLRLIFFGVAFE